MTEPEPRCPTCNHPAHTALGCTWHYPPTMSGFSSTRNRCRCIDPGQTLPERDAA
jgi:hypothetical protein